MNAMREKWRARERKHRLVRRKVSGTAERPRLSVYFSLHHCYAQMIDDQRGATLCAASTREGEHFAGAKNRSNVAGAAAVGKLLGERAKAKQITAATFDRRHYKYHGKVKALADAARQAGLKF
ncbi:MAG: 50S ribosomal protein L18 [Planctomycetes bacterium]|nr:50S ribosomal protein L18 [Planctomycetota bacterium]